MRVPRWLRSRRGIHAAHARRRERETADAVREAQARLAVIDAEVRLRGGLKR